jgi:hypothetical protein
MGEVLLVVSDAAVSLSPAASWLVMLGIGVAAYGSAALLSRGVGE